jgi:chromosome segregation ATPase
MAPETPDAAAIAHFLRRFADLMSTGQNATYLQHAAVLIETLTAGLTAALDEEQLWRYKYETVTRHADALEAECEGLKHDIEGHLDITTSVLSERDTLKAVLQGREAELSELGDVLGRERGEFATKLQAQEQAMAGLRVAFDRERDALKTTAAARDEELDQLRRGFEREREELAVKSSARDTELSELRVAFDRERDELQARSNASGEELAALRAASERENGELKAKIASLEAKRAELRLAFERISELKNQTNVDRDGADPLAARKPGLEAEANAIPAQPGDRDPALQESDAVVPKATLRQARAQFEYLAKECIPRGDIASQVMCELGAYTMDLALVAGQQTSDLPAGEVVLSILASPGSASPDIGNKM